MENPSAMTCQAATKPVHKETRSRALKHEFWRDSEPETRKHFLHPPGLDAQKAPSGIAAPKEDAGIVMIIAAVLIGEESDCQRSPRATWAVSSDLKSGERQRIKAT